MIDYLHKNVRDAFWYALLGTLLVAAAVGCSKPTKPSLYHWKEIGFRQVDGKLARESDLLNASGKYVGEVLTFLSFDPSSKAAVFHTMANCSFYSPDYDAHEVDVDWFGETNQHETGMNWLERMCPAEAVEANRFFSAK